MASIEIKHPHLLDPENLGGHRAVRGLGNRMLAAWLSKAAERVASKNISPASVSVVINAQYPRHPRSIANKRNHPGMMVDKINRTLDGIEGQAYPRELLQDIIVLHEIGMAIPMHERKGLEERATLEPISCRQNHSATLNIGIERARIMRPRIIALLDAGSHYATNQAFWAMADAVDSGFSAAFGTHLPDGNASVSQSLARTISTFFSRTDTPDPYKFDRGAPGFVPADGTSYMASRLPSLPFDETFGRGGGNNNFLRHPENDIRARFDPALTVQSGEWNLGPLALLAIRMEQFRVENPTQYDIRPATYGMEN